MSDFYDLPPLTTDAAQFGTKDWDIVQWCEERLERGIHFVEGQIGYDKIDEAAKAILSYEAGNVISYSPVKGLSKTRANLVAVTAEDIVASLTDVRYFWNYKTQNAKYSKQCSLTNKGGEMWYKNQNADLRIGDSMRFYAMGGTGYVHFYYSREINDFRVESIDPRHVFPIDPPTSYEIQDCKGIIMRMPRTPDWVKEEYGKTVAPESSPKGKWFGWLLRTLDGPASGNGGPLSRKAAADKPIPHTPTVFVNTMYLKDNRTNKSQDTLYMGPWKNGQPQAPWSYKVKPGGQLYPFKRMLVWGGGALLYDGPSPYWHAKFPLVKFTLNPWPMSWFGKAPLTDTLPLNESINKNLRVIDDHAAQVAEPATIGDRNVSRAEMNKVNTRAPGMKIRTNMASGKGIQIVPPPPLDSIIWEIIKWCEEKIPQMAGVANLGAIASLNQIPSDDTIDTLMKTMTPGNRLRSRILEGCYKELAYMFLYNFWEWDSLPRREAMFGPAGVTKEDFDYSPGSGVPDDVPDGEEGDIASTIDALQANEPRQLYERGKAMLLGIACEFDPSSLLNSAAQQELMKYFMLAKMGYVSVFTLMEKMGISNFAPEGLQVPADELGRLALQQQLGVGMIANAQGRKASDQAAPAMGMNSGGPTITTS